MNARITIVRDDSPRMLLNLAGIPKDIVNKVLAPEARLHAQELVRLTYPRKAADGRNKIEKSVRRMFLTKASESLSHFSNKAVRERVETLKGRGANQALAQVLKNVWKQSSQGVAMPVQDATPALMGRRRDYSAKWKGHARGPRSISSESAVRSTIRDLNQEVGGAKKGWVIPGVKAPAWVKSAKGPLGKHSYTTSHDLTEISVSNPERAMVEIEERSGIAAFVVKLRSRKVMAKVNFEMRRRLAGS